AGRRRIRLRPAGQAEGRASLGLSGDPDHGAGAAMPFALNLFHDQVAASGASSAPLPAAHRMLYVRHGRAVLNGQAMNADEAIYCDAPVTLQAADGWAQVWRWELALPNAAPLLLEGSGVLSSLRMSQVITHLALLEGSRWLFRLDQITS